MLLRRRSGVQPELKKLPGHNYECGHVSLRPGVYPNQCGFSYGRAEFRSLVGRTNPGGSDSTSIKTSIKQRRGQRPRTRGGRLRPGPCHPCAVAGQAAPYPDRGRLRHPESLREAVAAGSITADPCGHARSLIPMITPIANTSSMKYVPRDSATAPSDRNRSPGRPIRKNPIAPKPLMVAMPAGFSALSRRSRPSTSTSASSAPVPVVIPMRHRALSR